MEAGKAAPATEATPLAGERAKRARQGTSLLGATAILATFSTTSSNVQYPFVYGQLGLVLGPLAELALQGLMCALAMLTVRIAVRLECRTFSELGATLAGARWGGWFFGTVQMVNNVLFMPVALVLSAEALQQFMVVSLDCPGGGEGPQEGACDFWSCNANSLLISALCAWPVLLLARNVGELTWNGLVSTVLIGVQTITLVAASAATSPRGGDASITDIALIGPGQDTQWYTSISAIGVRRSRRRRHTPSQSQPLPSALTARPLCAPPPRRRFRIAHPLSDSRHGHPPRARPPSPVPPRYCSTPSAHSLSLWSSPHRWRSPPSSSAPSFSPSGSTPSPTSPRAS